MFNLYAEGMDPRFCRDEDKYGDRKRAVKLFGHMATGNYEVYSSIYVTEELERANSDKRNFMLDVFSKYDITILRSNAAVNELADTYISEGIIPLKVRSDALHIAIATVYGLDIIISQNFEHIVKHKTIRMTGSVNERKSYQPITIYSPEEAVKYAESRMC
jgi:hypothetical protein